MLNLRSDGFMLRTMREVFCLFGFLFVCPLFVGAQQVDNPTLDGLIIYKRYPFYQDRLAQPLEYRSASFHRNVTHVFLANGQRLVLPADADVSWIPYPGRGGHDRDTALIVITDAQARYPQHRRLLENVRRAWKRATPAELAVQQEKSQQRNFHSSNLIASIAKTVSSGISKLWETPSMLLSPSLNPSPTPAAEPQAASASDNPSSSTTLEKNLETIRKYYQTTNEM